MIGMKLLHKFESFSCFIFYVVLAHQFLQQVSFFLLFSFHRQFLETRFSCISPNMLLVSNVNVNVCVFFV